MLIQGLKYEHASEQLEISHWELRPSEHWGVFIAHAHSSELLVRIFSGALTGGHDAVTEKPDVVGIVSLSEQQRLLEYEIARDETDFQDHIDYGSSVENLLLEAGCSVHELQELLELTDLTGLRTRGFRQLSTGETRRLMLARALATHPELLVLHEPYSGLDVEHRQRLTTCLNDLAEQIQLVVITSREDELPACLTHIALFDERQLSQTITITEWRQHPILEQLTALTDTKQEVWLALSRQYETGMSVPDPRVTMNQVKVEYTDGLIFRDLCWEIKANQHWQIRGPNGCGKSTLLGLILGDHPQCYCNDITVLGMRRGSGESIWDIKRHIGIVSSSLHLQYRVSCTVLDVLLSGFFDSIGLYEKPSAKQLHIARDWLNALEMSQYEQHGFRQLDYGQQRLLLIVRALIKHPVLLILDEPYQGLDYLNRRLVMTVLNRLAEANMTQLLYVSHYEEDRLSAIHNYVDFVADPNGGYRVCITEEQ
ncbi:ATP-binding cassette domain-containing protein [Vibrio mangrovi]|uniref:ATP-binding cassette domain-containing protein n=1 Tax=Vibrio mangrovi TaxID=474394 RepID=A0A1Y6IYX3_9VIBR|nr:ATP-binding cassette domain-containing protein [Vibrio mangrovi]MDW6002714.1 ATP-binding cassette domain-containing protein [Vibrio mangrovi]SMS02875.1 putative ABC transporter ATP-binding protein YlmA [Vibrio mangrovi]